MNNEINFRNIIFFSILILSAIIVVDIFLKPEHRLDFSIVQECLRNSSTKQNIAPQRLYINVWRLTRNFYVDEKLNGQDWRRWKYRYVKRIKTMEDLNVAVNTMLASLNDPYTKFLQSDLFSKQKMVLDSKINGIGILFHKSGDEIVVNHILDNSPAKSSDIIPGDTIVDINGMSTKNIDSDKLVSYIEKSKTKDIEITFKRDNILIKKKLKKQYISISTMDYKITNDNIAIVTLANIMGEKAVLDFKNILEATNDAKAVVIDLRNNYGGILGNAIQMANYMLDEEKIVSIESRINSKYQIYSSNERIFKHKPMAILINKNTASAAEILAGTLKDNLKAIVIGENSFGKNSIQQVIPLPNGSGLILTTDKYILPLGEDIYGKGVVPDIEIKQGTKNKKDIQMEEAIKLLNIAVENEK